MTVLRYRPLSQWPGSFTAVRETSRFTAPLADTLRVLDRELDALNVVDAVVELAFPERAFRADGSLRADARHPAHPGVVLSFDAPGLGPLRYWTDLYDDCKVWESGSMRSVPGWHDNLRAIALGLEALRKVERYGIANRGEQYAGWKQLGAGTPLGPPQPMTRDEAARVLLVGADVTVTAAMVADLVDGADLPFVSTLYRMAARQHHPDAGGNADTFRKITEARDLLASDPKGLTP